MMNKEAKRQDLSVIILAGGESSRMKFPKAWLPHSSNLSILEHIINSYKAIGCEQIVVVMHFRYAQSYSKLTEDDPKVSFLKNYNPEKGRIHSLNLGIGKLNRSGLTFIHNVDNPYANKETLEALINSTISGYSRPVLDGRGGHPILVTNGVLENILLADESIILKDLLKEHSREDVNVKDHGVLCNINTPDEYRAIFGMDVPTKESFFRGRLG